MPALRSTTTATEHAESIVKNEYINPWRFGPPGILKKCLEVWFGPPRILKWNPAPDLQTLPTFYTDAKSDTRPIQKKLGVNANFKFTCRIVDYSKKSKQHFREN